MALISIGMTQEQVQKVLEPMAAGVKTLVYVGLLADGNNGDSPIFATAKGGKMVKAKFTCLSSDPNENGKGIIYNGVLGSFSFAKLTKRVPILTGMDIDTEAGIGMELQAEVTLEDYLTKDGEARQRNGIKEFLA